MKRVVEVGGPAEKAGIARQRYTEKNDAESERGDEKAEIEGHRGG